MDGFSSVGLPQKVPDSFFTGADMYNIPYGIDWLNSLQFPYNMSHVTMPSAAGFQENFAMHARKWNTINLRAEQQMINYIQESQSKQHLQQQVYLFSPTAGKPDQEINSGCAAGGYQQRSASAPNTVTGAYSNLDLESMNVQVQLQQNCNKDYIVNVQCPVTSSTPDTGERETLNSFGLSADGTCDQDPTIARSEINEMENGYGCIPSIPTEPDSSMFCVGSNLHTQRSPPNGTSPKLETMMAEMRISREAMSQCPSPPEAVEKAAIEHRHAASNHEAACTWRGNLPHKKIDNPIYSNKVFLGGVPWDITVENLQQAFSSFGNVAIEFPGSSSVPKHGRFAFRARGMADDSAHCFGYVYVIFESDRQVKAMLQACKVGQSTKEDGKNDDDYYYYQVSSRKMKQKEVQVIPWLLGDSNFVAGSYPCQRLNHDTTIFVGALHGMLNAEGLAQVMNDLFGDVVYAGVDTDKHKYPIGSGRVTFRSQNSYIKAVNAGFVEIKTTKFVKKVQIDPYLEEMPCSCCSINIGPFFCRNPDCFKYYCSACWTKVHNGMDPSTGVHSPVMRNSKNGACITSARAIKEFYT